MRRVLTIATVLGLIGVVETFGILVIAKKWFQLTDAQIQSFIYLKLAVAGHMTLFVARTRRPFFSKPYPAPILLGAILGTQAIGGVDCGLRLAGCCRLHGNMSASSGFIALVWVFIEDWAKLRVYRHLEFKHKTAP